MATAHESFEELFEEPETAGCIHLSIYLIIADDTPDVYCKCYCHFAPELARHYHIFRVTPFPFLVFFWLAVKIKP